VGLYSPAKFAIYKKVINFFGEKLNLWREKIPKYVFSGEKFFRENASFQQEEEITSFQPHQAD
jgi:hypothetical protein